MRTRLTSRDAVRYLVLIDSSLSVEDIQSRLEWLGLPSCTSFLVSQIRRSLRDHLRFLKQAGLLRNKPPLIPSRLRRLKPPKHFKEFYYQ